MNERQPSVGLSLLLWPHWSRWFPSSLLIIQEGQVWDLLFYSMSSPLARENWTWDPRGGFSFPWCLHSFSWLPALNGNQIVPPIFHFFAANPFDKWCALSTNPSICQGNWASIERNFFTTPFLWSYKTIKNGNFPRDPGNGMNNLTRIFLRTALCPSLLLDVCACYYFLSS